MIPIGRVGTTPVVGGVLIRQTAAVDGLGIIERLLAQRTTLVEEEAVQILLCIFEKRVLVSDSPAATMWTLCYYTNKRTNVRNGQVRLEYGIALWVLIANCYMSNGHPHQSVGYVIKMEREEIKLRMLVGNERRR